MNDLDYTALDDQMLVTLIARAQPLALSELYDRYSRLVFSLARNMVTEQTAAEEITLDVFHRVWEKAHTYRPEQAKVSTWLVSITRHRAIDWLRRQKVRPNLQSLRWADVPPDALPVGNSPEDAAETAFRREQVLAAVAQLPPDQRQALAMAYFGGYTHRQIAELLEQPLGTIKTRIRLAMRKLRALLQEV